MHLHCHSCFIICGGADLSSHKIRVVWGENFRGIISLSFLEEYFVWKFEIEQLFYLMQWILLLNYNSLRNYYCFCFFGRQAFIKEKLCPSNCKNQKVLSTRVACTHSFNALKFHLLNGTFKQSILLTFFLGVLFHGYQRFSLHFSWILNHYQISALFFEVHVILHFEKCLFTF